MKSLLTLTLFVLLFNPIYAQSNDYQTKGFVNITTVGISPNIISHSYEGSTRYNYNNYGTPISIGSAFNFQTSFGYQFNEHFTTLLGGEIDKFTSANTNIGTNAIATQYIQQIVSFRKGRFTPLFDASIGYSEALNQQPEDYYYSEFGYGQSTIYNKGDGGKSLGFEIGIKKNLSKHISYLLFFGYKRQYLYYTQTFSQYYFIGENKTIIFKTQLYDIYNLLSIRTGFQF